MENSALNKKGQVSIEFLFIFMIALVYIYSVVQPGIDIASEALEDVSGTSQAKLAAEKIANAANELFVSDGEGKKTIHILVPENAVVSCNPAAGEIEFSIALSEKLAGITSPKCSGRTCNGSIPIVSASITCSGDFAGKNFFTLQLVKNAAGEVNVS